MSKKWSIGIVDDDARFREHLAGQIDKDPGVEDVFVWETAELFLRDPRRRECDLYCVDCVLPHMNGVELIERIKQEEPESPVLLLTGAASDDQIFHAIKAGASGCIWKSDLADVIREIKLLLDGGASMSPTIALRVMNALRQEPRDPGLTRKERQVLDELVRGRSAAGIADLFRLKLPTVKTHISNIYKKLHVHNRASLVREAWNRGLVRSESGSWD